MPFDELLAAATALQVSMERAAGMTKLPGDVDHKGVDALLGEVLRLP